MKKRFIPFIMSAVIAMTSVPVSATTITRNASQLGMRFDCNYGVVIVYDNNRWFEAGFDTAFINEDYAYAMHKKNNFTVYVSNGMWSDSKNGTKGKYKQADVTHIGGSVTYKFKY